jgi:hypothetical protein
MPDAWLTLSAAVALASLAPVIVRFRAAIRGTALAPAWRAALIVWLVGLIVTGVTVATLFLAGFAIARLPVRPWLQGLSYVCAVLALTPPIAVLGARRPTVRAWTWFVLVPLVLVFIWPIVPAWQGLVGTAAFSIEEPVLCGYGLVLVMGAGNYLGLRYTPAALLWMAGLLLVVLPLCPGTAGWSPAAGSGWALGMLSLAAAAWVADRLAGWRPKEVAPGRLPLDRVWCDFRDLFGIVWARRIQERFNEDARQKNLPLRLGIQGLERTDGAPPGAGADPQSLASAEASLRWRLQKFVDAEWIDRRIDSSGVR